ncbi:head-tail connector protein [Thermoflavimicrobium dichotomicum]|uniref:Phage gp6-like head-tail connector protein n=1 Tax=Thermoflavimicrobium dichotomicum TaxID=46223 RepID=A0A1I3UMN8_9BACL|nr:head-tail connector protein [Thermoflavimicrobium dichotomicum]SFJ83176.1 Phage gp6-like head-tail connector protein [Thermoflavimicrobium dichotomicum]
MTVDEVKALLRISGTQHDSYLSVILPMAKEFVTTYCNREFKDDQGAESFPDGVKIAIAKICEFHMKQSGVQSETLARHSVTYSNEYPSEIKTILNNYRRPKFV